MIETIVVTPFAQNCRVIWDSSSKDAVVVDPGGEATRIARFLESKGLLLSQVWLTHSHIDHVGGVGELCATLPATLYGHAAERQMRAHVLDICAMYGLPSQGFSNCPEPTQYLKGGESVQVGSYAFEVLFTPGHSPGHLAFYCAEAGVVLSGDVLFQGSIGRTDLPGGDFHQLLKTIEGMVKQLPGKTRVLSGHGPDTTLDTERATNPFLENVRV